MHELPQSFDQIRFFVSLSTIDNLSIICSKHISIGQFTIEMTDFVAILILSLVASVQGQETCADAYAKIPNCAVGFIQMIFVDQLINFVFSGLVSGRLAEALDANTAICNVNATQKY